MQMNRLFEIVYMLLNREAVTARELAEHFGVSQRTIYRDVDALSLAGIPIYTQKGKGGGIRLLPDYIFNKFIFNEQEQNEILSALQGLAGVRAAEPDPILQKLSALFNRNIIQWLAVDFSDWSDANRGVFSNCKTAILESRLAEFDYYGSCGEMTHRRIEPTQLWFKANAWYLKGYCLLRQDIRLFKLSRVRNLIITDESFSERHPTAGTLKTPPSGRQRSNVTLKLKIAPEMTYRVYDEFGEKYTEKQPDGSFVVSVTWPEDDWVYGTILSYGEYIEVLEPAHIREILKAKLLKIAEKYR